MWIDFVDAYTDLCAVNTLPVDILASVYRWSIVACLDIGNNKLGSLSIYPTLRSICLCNCFTCAIVKFQYIFFCYFYFDKWYNISTVYIYGCAKQKSVSWKLKDIQGASAAQLEDLIVCWSDEWFRCLKHRVFFFYRFCVDQDGRTTGIGFRSDWSDYAWLINAR